MLWSSGLLRLANELQNLVRPHTMVLPHVVDGNIAVPTKAHLRFTDAGLL